MAHEGRGHYKIFLGMAAGVGKTYRMLQEGQIAQAAGRDVAIGYMEPHDRPETAALAAGLETIPRRRVTYRDTALKEMDLPALLARAPELALIDELAEVERETGRRVYNVLQLRHHDAILKLREKVAAAPRDNKFDVELTYITCLYHCTWVLIKF